MPSKPASSPTTGFEAYRYKSVELGYDERRTNRLDGLAALEAASGAGGSRGVSPRDGRGSSKEWEDQEGAEDNSGEHCE